MKISSIPQFYRNVKRWTEILAVLSKYGLADWLSQLNIDFVKDQLKAPAGEALARQSRSARIRLALAELGPTFIKLGQLLSTRTDLIGVELAEELKSLQSSAPADPPDTVREIVESELGQPIDELFAEFDDTAIASASIGQVHRARLKTGESVAVKVQHAGIDSVVREDLDVLAGLAMLAEKIPEFAPYRPTATVAEMARTLRRELDFGREERNLMQFSALLADNPHVRIPQSYDELCTPRVLTMEWIEGIKFSESSRLAAEGYDLEEIARRGVDLYLEMIFNFGFYHADPHPGNILILPGNVISLIDFGMVGRIDEGLREDIEEMLLSIVNRDTPMLTALIMRIGQTPPGLDERALANDVADFVGSYAGQSLAQFDLAGALNDMVEMVRRYHIILPTPVSMLIKVLVTLEGSSKILCPTFSLMEAMQPFQRKMFLRRLSPARQFRKMRRMMVEVEQLVSILPRRITEILDQIQAGKFDVHLDHRGLGPSVNRLVLGMLASALFLGSSLMLSREVTPVLFPVGTYFGMHRLSLLGLAGCTLSILLGLRLLWAIGKSGHLDQRD